MGVTFQLNGRQASSAAPVSSRLVDILRDEFGLTGTNVGCGEGECGACTVLVDGRPVLSCIMALGSVHQRQVTTIEGLWHTPGFEILCRAFNEAGAVQCGFCTPAMIVSAYALLRDDPDADEQKIREAMAGNLCRCTGYGMILDAILMAAKERKRIGKWEKP